MSKEYGPFAQHFVTMFAPEILSIYLHQVELFVSGQAWLSKKCQYQIFQFFTEWYDSVCSPFTFEYHLNVIISQCETKVDLDASQTALRDSGVVLRIPPAFVHSCEAAIVGE